MIYFRAERLKVFLGDRWGTIQFSSLAITMIIFSITQYLEVPPPVNHVHYSYGCPWGGGGLFAVVGYSGICHFPWVYFLPENSRAGYQFYKGNILLGNRPDFFVEHMMESGNQPYCFRSAEKDISTGKFLKMQENFIIQVPNSGKLAPQGVIIGQNSKAGCLFRKKFSEAGCH